MHTPSSSNTNRPFQQDRWLVHIQYTEAIPIPRFHKDLFADTAQSLALCAHTHSIVGTYCHWMTLYMVMWCV